MFGGKAQVEIRVTRTQRTAMVGLRGEHVAFRDPHRRVIGQRQVDQVIEAFRRQARNRWLAHRPGIDVAAENLGQTTGGILEVVQLSDQAGLGPRQPAFGLL